MIGQLIVVSNNGLSLIIYYLQMLSVGVKFKLV